MANTGTGFVLSNGTVSAPAAFIFATLDGHIEAWSPRVDPLTGTAEDKVTVRDAGYTGLAIALTEQGDRLFAADFLKDRIDVFDSAFNQAAARDLLAALLPVCERVSGPEHPDTLIICGKLARWTGEAGDPGTARDLLAALLPVRERVSGPEHPDTLTTRRQLAYWTERAERGLAGA